jgi:hypothetical protein
LLLTPAKTPKRLNRAMAADVRAFLKVMLMRMLQATRDM